MNVQHEEIVFRNWSTEEVLETVMYYEVGTLASKMTTARTCFSNGG